MSGLWMQSDQLDSHEVVEEVIKHGTLALRVVGLAECLVALTGKHHGESDEAKELGIEIIKILRQLVDEASEKYNLNFTCLATPAEGLSGRFTSIDKAIYGKIKGVTDRNYYTNSFHVPVHYNITIKNKLHKEAPYHALTNAGHISYIELDGDPSENLDAFERVVRIMKEEGIGYGAVNHPVDRDPVCGYVGVIGDVCPGCGRREGESVSLEKITTLNCGCK
jgi:ribonucleoside-triphosphate reductase